MNIEYGILNIVTPVTQPALKRCMAHEVLVVGLPS